MKNESYSYIECVDNIIYLSEGSLKTYIHKETQKGKIASEFENLYFSLKNTNKKYFCFQISIYEYVKEFDKWTCNLKKLLLNHIVSQDEFSDIISNKNFIFNHNDEYLLKKEELKELQNILKVHHFYQIFDEFLYIYASSINFFKTDLLSKEIKLTLLKFLNLVIDNN